MNSINLVGRLTKDPELRRTGEGTSVCSYSLAVKRPRASDKTDFIDCVTWRQGAEYLCQYGHKGDVVAVSGSLQSREWTDKNGNNRVAWEVVTDSVELLGSRKKQESGNPTNSQNSYSGIPTGQYGPQVNAPAYTQPSYPQQGAPSYAQQGFGDYSLLDGKDKDLPF